MERNWQKELREILKRNNMSEEYIEKTVEYGDTIPEVETTYDEYPGIEEPVIGRIMDSEEDRKIDADVPSCWSNLKNNEYAPAYVTVPKVPAGVYEIGWNGNLQTYTVKKQPFKSDELYHLPSYEITDILKLVALFNHIKRQMLLERWIILT